jgi:glycerol-1-phosphate dehydrogenase [NAD(P)+]
VSTRSVAIPRLLHVGGECLGQVEELLVRHRFNLESICVASGAGPSLAIADGIADRLKFRGRRKVFRVGDLDGTLCQAEKVANALAEHQVTCAVGVGGGRAIDTMKLAAARAEIEYVSVPTTISHDGISSPVASLEGPDGRRASHAAAMPAGVVVDTEIIGAAPIRMLRAGVADLVSNRTAVMDWQLADQAGEGRFDQFSAMLANSAAHMVLDLGNLTTPESHERLANGLVLSGLAMAVAGTSRPCSGAEHLISHSLDQRLGREAALHGEQVALGCLISAAAHKSSLLPVLRKFFTELDIPTHPSTLHIETEQMIDAVLAAPATRPDRFTVLSTVPMDRANVNRLLDRAFNASASAVRTAF